jgi:hypothetical protein
MMDDEVHFFGVGRSLEKSLLVRLVRDPGDGTAIASMYSVGQDFRLHMIGWLAIAAWCKEEE